MAISPWIWRTTLLDEPTLGPRDWSPKVDQALRKLKSMESLVPPRMLLTKEEAQQPGCPPIIRDAVLAGTAFVVKVRDTHEVVYVGRTGSILMSGYMQAVFSGYWDSVEAGLAAKVWDTPGEVK